MSEATKQVLLVDDDAEFRAKARGWLAASPEFQVSEAETGAKGVAACKERKIDCAIVNYDNADLDGLKFLDALVGPSGTVTTPVVMLLSKDKKMTVAKVLSSGAMDYLIKADVVEASLERAVRNAAEMKGLDNRLKEQRNIFMAILNGTPGFLMLKNLQHQYQAINPVFCQFVGKKANEIIGKTDADLFPADLAAANMQIEKTVLSGDKPAVETHEYTGVSGKAWLQIARSPLKDAAGNIVGVLCVGEDVSAAKALEAKLHQHTETGAARVGELESALAKAQQALEAREQAAAQQGAALEQATAAASAEAEKFNTALAAAKAEAAAAIGAAELRATDAEAALKPARDLAAAAEARLAGAAERFHHMAQIVPAVLCEVGVDSKLSYLNPAGSALFGHSGADIAAGINLGELFHADERARLAQSIKETMQGKAFGPVDFRMLKKGGTGEFMARISAIAVTQDGKIAGMRFSMIETGDRERLAVAAAALKELAGAAAKAGAIADRLVSGDAS